MCRDLLEADRDKALTGSSAPSQDRPSPGVQAEGPTARGSRLRGGGSGSQAQGEQLSSRNKVGLGNRLPSWEKLGVASRGWEGEDEREGII